MTAKIAILSALLTCCNGLSIGTVSDQKVNQSETSIGDAFPDWVPFKNKHGDELGQFVPVGKSKIKKRLAAPVNFILRAVAEPESEDYYDKGQGGGDSEDNYESKDWSDLHRPAEPVDNSKQINHTDISDIDGVIGILTRKRPKSIVDAINNARKVNTEIMTTDEPDEEDENEDSTTEKTTEKITTEEDAYIDESRKDKKQKNSEEDVDYDEGSSEKQKLDPSEDVSESEAKKAKILDAVDELKERHAGESRAIAEKVEEEMYKEEFERNRFHPVEQRDKYGRRKKYKKITPDYEEYDDKNASLQDKYKVNPIVTETTTQTAIKYAPHKNKLVESGKLSVFKNPHLYMVYDDSEEVTFEPKQETVKPQKFSSRYTSTPSLDNGDERISLVPEDSKEGEPTLFLPKKRKSKKRKIKTSPATDSYIAETVTEKLKQIADTTAADTRVNTAPATGNDVTATGNYVTAIDNDVTVSGADATDVTGPSAVDTTGNEADDVTDAVPASTDHKKEKTSGDYHSEKGGGHEHDSEFEEEHEEHGKKAYEGHHEDTKTAKGHHDKHNHLGKYEDHGGVDKHHSEESGHYGNHNHEEHGKKHAEYEESGKHSKGHSTKGSHDVHKKDEYEKKVEFFEEDGDSAEEEKHGGYNQEKEHSEGGKYKKENLKLGHQHHTKGESGHFGNGRHLDTNKGYKEAVGYDSHGKHGGRHSHKGSKDGGKKWIYHHGSPPRTANLVVIDRREDQPFHSPLYYG